MTRITIDNELMAKLHNCTIPLELCDEDGYVLGRLEPVTPEKPPGEPQSDDPGTATDTS